MVGTVYAVSQTSKMVFDSQVDTGLDPRSMFCEAYSFIGSVCQFFLPTANHYVELRVVPKDPPPRDIFVGAQGLHLESRYGKDGFLKQNKIN